MEWLAQCVTLSILLTGKQCFSTAADTQIRYRVELQHSRCLGRQLADIGGCSQIAD